MELVIGGMYQGKLEYAMDKYALSQSDVFTCDENSDVPETALCINRYEKYVQYCVSKGETAKTEFPDAKVIICDDIFCGVVPIDGVLRESRESTGRALAVLAEKADTVTRIFCGIPQRLK